MMTSVVALMGRAMVPCRTPSAVALAAFVVLASVARVAAHSGAVTVAVRAPSRVVIDGDLAEWAGALPIPLNTATIEFTYGRVWDPIRDDDTDLDAVLYVMWSPDTLYVGCHVADDVVNVRGIDPFAPYFHDALLVLFEGAHQGEQASRRDLFLALGGPEGPVRSVRTDFEAGRVGHAPDIRVAGRRTEIGYDLEAAVAASRLGVAPAVGATAGFSFVVTDRDTDDQPVVRQMMWSAASTVPDDPGGWGNLSFVERAAPRDVLEYALTPGAWYTTEDEIVFGVWGLPPLVRPQRLTLAVMTLDGIPLVQPIPRLLGAGTWRARALIRWSAADVPPGTYDLVARFTDFSRQEWEKILGPWPTLERLTSELGERLDTVLAAAREIGGPIGEAYEQYVTAMRRDLESARDEGRLHLHVRGLRDRLTDLEVGLVDILEGTPAGLEQRRMLERAPEAGPERIDEE